MVLLTRLNDTSLCSYDSSLFRQQMTVMLPKTYIIVIIP